MITPIIGRTGSGKTEIGRRIVLRNAGRYRLILVDDFNTQWTEEKLARTYPELARTSGYVTTLHSVHDLYDTERVKGYKKIIRLSGLRPHELLQLAEYVCGFHPQRDMEAKAPDICVVFDELYRACSPKRGWEGGERGAFWDLMLSHRHLGVHVVAGIQDPYIVDRRIVDNTNETFMCKMEAIRGLKWIEQTYGEEYSNLVRRLPPTFPPEQCWPFGCVIWRAGQRPEYRLITNV